MFYVLNGGLSVIVNVIVTVIFNVLIVVEAQAEVCSLAVNPSALPIRQIFENETSGFKVFEMLYRPANASISLASFSGNLAEIYKNKFDLRIMQESVFELVTTNESLHLPQYPSKSSNIFLTVNILCNGNVYPVSVLQIKSANLKNPVFYRTPYSIDVPESFLPNSLIDTPILAIDWDPAPSYSVKFNIENDQYGGLFQLDQSNGLVHTAQNLPIEIQNENWTPEQLPSVVKLKLLKSLDFDNGTRTYILNISAKDNPSIDGVAPKTTYATLTIHVMDSDDMPPIFEQSSYKGNISQDAETGASVFLDRSILAKDGDKTLNSSIKYSLTPNSEYFEIDPKTAIVRMKKSFDHHSLPRSFDLIVKAEQSHNSHHASTALLHIDTQQSSPNSLSFRPCNYNVSLPENSPAGTQVVQLIADDPNHYYFELLDTKDAGNFTLNNATGVIYVAPGAALDREKQPIYSLLAVTKPINEAENISLHANSDCPMARILLTLLDENDNSPVFSADAYNFTILDTISRNQPIGIIRATDTDSGPNGEVVFRIADADPTDGFRFVVSPYPNGTAEILIDFTQGARPKFKSPYQFSVEASDKGLTPRTSRAKVTVSVVYGNSHVPTFEQSNYNVNISENLSNGTRVVQVYATDPDEGEGGVFTYYINDTTATFDVDPVSGWVTVINENHLDRETTKSFTFTVGTIESVPSNASSNGPRVATVVVSLLDVNDNPPHFIGTVNGSNTYEFTVDISLPPNSTVGQIQAIDPDEGPNGFVSFNPVSIPSPFRMNNDGKIVLQSALRPTSNSLYNLIFEARDNPVNEKERKSTVGMAKIFVTGVENTEMPKFTNLPNIISISESFPLNSLIYTIGVTDLDPPVSPIYRIVTGNENKTFYMKENSIFVKDKLDAESDTNYDLFISYEGKQNKINDTLKIIIEDANDNAPIFNKSKYQFLVNDSVQLTQNLLVGQVHATDLDISFPNNAVVYEMETDTKLPFSLDPTTGELRLTSTTDLKEQYLFSIVAHDRGEPPLKDVAFVTVTFASRGATTNKLFSTINFSKDVSTGPTLTVPKFTQIQYAITIPENVSGRNISSVVATHPSGTIVYSLVTKTDLFKIDPDTGRVVTTGSLDYEKTKEYRLNISGCLKSTPDLCGYTTLLVEVLDVNDNPPKFNETEYRVAMPTDAVIGSRVIQVTATDLDSDANKDISYALKSGAATFTIDYETGWISTVADLMPTVYNITVEAYDHGRPPLKTEVNVIITVNGTNPHEPKFDYFVYNIAVKENLPVGTYVVQTIAHDPDPGEEGRVTYRFKEPSPEFIIDPNTGKITTTQVLDYETRTQYELIVVATDHALVPRSGTTVVSVSVLDVNDNPPIFEPVPDKIYISSSKVPGSPIFTMKATDKDSAVDGNNEIVYFLSPENRYFQILPETNVLSVKQTLVPGTFNVVLMAMDKGHPPLNSTHPVQIIVMGDSLFYPIFKELAYDIKLGKNSTFPQVVQVFQAKVKDGDITYNLLPVNTKGFILDHKTGELTATEEIFDNLHLMETRYLIIRAINTKDKNFFSDVSLTVTLTNFENMNIPLTFTSTLYRAMIKENSPAGTDLNLTISVNNSEAFGSKLRYWLLPNDTFTINERGEIFSLKPIDLEALDLTSDGIITIQVFASNDVTVTSTILQVKVFDVNEFAPQFNATVYTFRISENATPGTILFNVQAEDKDFNDKRLRYQLIPSEGAKYVVVGGNGDIIKSASPLFDRETNATILFTLQATDQGNKTAQVQIIINVLDENDNAPTFVGLPYVWNVTEGNDSVGKTFSISAKDLDEGENARVQFRILDGNNKGNFLLTDKGNNQAELSVVKQLNRDERSQFILVVEARDNGRPPLFTVSTIEVNVLDINNNAPKFYRKIYETQVTTTFPVNYPFITVYAEDTDQNANLSFKISNDTSGFFQMNAATGQISLKQPLPKVNATYNIVVEVTDGKFTDRANVSFVVVSGGETPTVIPRIPPQFKKPLFNFSAMENKDNVAIGQIEISAPDVKSLKLSVEPEQYKELFEINSTGFLVAKKPLHYLPGKGSVSFLVSAQDNSDPPLKVFVPVVVDITDVNDHVPEFSQPDYVGLVPFSAKKGYTIALDIRATDLDSGINAEVAYSLRGADANCFQMDNKSAQITLLCDLNFNQKNLYKLQVVATDRNGEGNSSAANLTIIVLPSQVETTTTGTDIQTPPNWQNGSCDSFNFTIPMENLTLIDRTPVSTPISVIPVWQLSASNPSCKTVYGVVGPGNEYFTVNQMNGLIKTAKDIDLTRMRQENIFSPNFTGNVLPLTVSANLPDGRKLSATLATITILPTVATDEDRVIFDSKSYTFEIEEEQKIGTLIGQVNASSNSTLPFHYMVLFSRFFIISDPRQGIIVTNAVFDYEGPIKQYEFLVQATNSRSTDFTAVTVTLIDVNDNNPEFSQNEYTFEIPEGPYGSGATVGFVDAHDKDSGLNALLNYTIVETNVPFHIDPTNGRLQAFGNIDREQVAFYRFHVMVVDNGEPPLSATVAVNVTIIDVNDNPPRFVNTSTNIFLPDNTPAKQTVTQVFAVDPDEGINGRVVFKLQSNEDTFSIGQEDGIIRTLVQISAKRRDVYNLVVVASDLGRPPQMTTLNITVRIVNGTSGRPAFPQDVYYKEIPSTSDLNVTLLQVSAGQGDLVYTIIEGNDLKLFDIMNETGEIRLHRVPRSEEFGKGYTITVTATNRTSGDTASTTVRLFIVDQRGQNVTISPQQRAFEKSQYWVDIAENLAPPVFVIDLNSTFELQRQPVVYKILSGSLDRFTINETSGVVYTSQELDRENQSLYIMTVQARPAGPRTKRQSQQQQRFLGLNEFIQINWDETILVVNVTDVNDNAPYFPDGKDLASILTSGADTKSGQIIGSVKAVDPDISSILQYSIVPNPNDDSDKFSINSQSGAITATRNFDQLSSSEFHFTVLVTDGLFNATTPVIIYKILPDVQAIIQVNRKPEYVQLYVGLLEKSLTRLTGWNVSVSGVKPSDTPTANQSDVYVYAIDPSTRRIIDGKTLSQKLASILPLLQKDLDNLKIQNVISAPLTSAATSMVSGPEIALIVISSLIILLALLGLLFMLRWWKKKEAERINSEYMLDSQSSGTRPYEVVTVDPKTGTITSLPAVIATTKRMESVIIAHDPNEPYETPGTIPRPHHFSVIEEVVYHHAPVRF